MPQVVVHGPLQYMGLNISNLYTEQFVTQLTMVLRYGNKSEETTGLLIHGMVEAMKFETRLTGEMLQTPLLSQDLMMDIWIKQLWLDCVNYGIDIYTDLPNFPIPRSGDIKIMRLFAQHGV